MTRLINTINKGKDLENLVSLIQEALKDSPSTIIYTNQKIPNRGGRKREFDILIETTINNFLLKIAIECKEYNKPVGVEKIEAFQGKCSRMPDINKKVFVSSKGYQADAINAANEFGIDLYHVKDINSETVTDWFPIKQLKLRVNLKDYTFGIIADDPDIDILNTPPYHHQFIYNSAVVEDLNVFIIDRIKLQRDELWNINLSEFIKDTKPGKVINIPFKLEFNNSAFVQVNEDVRFPIGQISGDFDTWLEASKPDKIISKSLVTNEESQAQYVSFDNASFGKAEIVITPNKTKFYHTDLDGSRVELKTLGRYDPKTDIYTSYQPEHGGEG